MHFKISKYLQAETRLSGMLDYSLFCIHLPSMRYDVIFREISAFRSGECEAFVLLLPEVQRPQLKYSFLSFFLYNFLGITSRKMGTTASFVILSAERVVKLYNFVSHWKEPLQMVFRTALKALTKRQFSDCVYFL